MSDDIKVPRNNKYLESKTNNKRTKVEEAFDGFKNLLADKTHPDNQSPAFHNHVVSVLNQLLVAADELDSESPGEGIFGLIILSLRSSLKLKDDNLKLEVEIRALKREMEKLKKNPMIK
tara:strand:+ start:4090 stop:4446 length:357 start_codon:yes stop_codon:yes gene_type:complete